MLHCILVGDLLMATDVRHTEYTHRWTVVMLTPNLPATTLYSQQLSNLYNAIATRFRVGTAGLRLGVFGRRCGSKAEHNSPKVSLDILKYVIHWCSVKCPKTSTSHQTLERCRCHTCDGRRGNARQASTRLSSSTLLALILRRNTIIAVIS